MSQKPFLKATAIKEHIGTPVDVYFNLHTHLWSVRNRKTGLVMFHTDQIALDDVKFVVSEAGRQRVLKEKRKNVHAFVRGTIGKWRQAPERNGSLLVSYNPYRGPTFTHAIHGNKDNLMSVHAADFAWLDRNGERRDVWAKNAK
jgi:hypothetical protein